MLPDGLFALFQPRYVGCAPECVLAMFGKPGFYQAPAGGEVGIVRRQSPDAVKMIGHDHNCIDFERTRLANGSEGIAQNIDSFIRSQNGPAMIRHEGEKEGATRNDGARYCMGNVGLRCANPTYVN